MYLQDGTRAHFLDFISRQFPAMLPRFERLYAKKYPPEAYRKEVKAMVSVLQRRYGVARREEALRPLQDGKTAGWQEGQPELPLAGGEARRRTRRTETRPQDARE
jgi:hypothetical protein